MRLTYLLLLAVLALFGAGYMLRDLPPPNEIRFAAGARGGGYWSIAEQYRTHLAEDGIRVEILETAGSVENLDLLATGDADVGLLQGGIQARGVPIEALGTVFVEPIVVLARKESDVPVNAGRWSGLRIARGGAGSGTRVAAQQLLEALEIDQRNTLSDLGGGEAAQALLDGQVDVAIFVTPVASNYLRPLFEADDIELIRLRHADAIALRLPHSRVVRIPSGAISLDPVNPVTELPMVALMARLAAVEDLHPAVVDRLLQSARDIHGDSGIFARQGQFPTAEAADMPIDPGALKLLVEGQSAFHDWLPYWVAAQIRRVLLVLLPLLFLVVPLFRVLPEIYRWSMKRRVWRHYQEIWQIEAELRAECDHGALERLDARLEKVDRQLAAMRLPGPFRSGAYEARLHVDLVRRRISDLLEQDDG